ncbi:hypothetical protein [Sorangium sp. So ce861]
MADPSPRAAVVASLASTLSRAVALGDEVAARPFTRRSVGCSGCR